MIVYDNLWKTMQEKGVTQYALIKKYGVSPAQITRLKRNESVSTNTINMFCEILGCEVSDVMSFSGSKRMMTENQEAAGSSCRSASKKG